MGLQKYCEEKGRVGAVEINIIAIHYSEHFTTQKPFSNARQKRKKKKKANSKRS